MGYKVFAAGEEALASDVNSLLMSQSVARFTTAAQRTTLLAAPVLNQLSMLDTSTGIDRWTGSAWESSGWLTYTPTWKGGSTNPAIGNGTLTGRYAVLAPKVIAYAISLTFGSSTNGGTGAYTLGIPFPVDATIATPGTLVCLTNGGGVWAGVTVPLAADLSLFAPGAASQSNLGNVASANSSASAGTGIPLVAGQYSFAPGNWIRVAGLYVAA